MNPRIRAGTMMLEMVTATRFKLLHRNRARKDVQPVRVQKVLESPAVTVGDETQGRTLRFCCSSSAVDRERDVINQDGWVLDNFKRNAVVLWAHDARALPVGQVTEIGNENGKLMATVDFVPFDTPVAGEFAEAVFRLCKLGFLKATSVGFQPLDWEFTTDKDRGADDWFPGIDFQRQELMELSIVTVPANPEALLDDTAAPKPEHIDAQAASAVQEEVAAEVAQIARRNARDRRRRVLAAILTQQE
jgi:HK97 family phage prohead protease